ncbi:para-aminobenzoate synthetase component 1 [Microbacteriaceae bacterium SG_E_30_P1]|uniref:Para-aminobenzoate synthetase component 1 n=1 Tax=Antiquaquibacter oligotrophicus TaxID=2880260 RepID=A0ABT6KPY7_9MICO|nr:anthranilate synthase component I family protein [Antiquaquibacter oligotrophicus]MDH6181167.1 para-aminobenzoate synthetase component 1 [Antiquaquibacter oligotrophicus]UDF13137.1 anthranilate synthase component I family protein [Antiquaquibacter oligotrophicus]
MRLRLTTADLGRWVDPETAWMAWCASHPSAFWLDSGASATTGMSYLGIAAETRTSFDGPVLDWLREQSTEVDVASVAGGFRLGWVGWFGYELRSETMGTPRTRQSRYPDAAWLRIEQCLAFDHTTHTVYAYSVGDAEGFRDEVLAALDATPPLLPPDSPAPASDATWAYSDEEYLAMIRECQAAIREGDAYQLCLTTEARVDVSPDPFETYRRLRASSPTHHGALLVADGVALLSASPETFLTVSPSGVVTTSPIKGTRPRGADDAADHELRVELEASAKERAENLMIVDLMRNDLTRVCRVGSVDVTSLLTVESYAHVHQLVSTVRGELLEGLTAIDAVEACFPAGSMTGAPKRSATLILDRLERRARGIYSGAFGYLGFDGALDLAMVIRSIVIDAAGSTVGTGGGITALSIPEEELDEARLKAAALLAVLGARA